MSRILHTLIQYILAIFFLHFHPYPIDNINKSLGTYGLKRKKSQETAANAR